ncbi:MAG: endonuclease MutS2 [Firmicutes bacterium]|jgi:DNA mismatch repair protein MutS2|nr:endonuclease MutS2 [Bacillota bacterium]
MQEKSLLTLEFPKIKSMLKELVASGLGSEKVEEMKPSVDYNAVCQSQKETSEASQILQAGANPLSGLHDIRAALTRASLNGILTGEDFLKIASSLATSERLRKLLEESDGIYPQLVELGIRLSSHRKLENDILLVIDDNGEVKDNASPVLRRLRINIRQTQHNMKNRMDSLIRNPNIQRHLQDNIITIRNDRYVVPVRLESKSAIPGIVHDTSNSGATLFVEPMALVDMNNELKQLHSQEREEVMRIFRELSEKIALDYPALRQTVDALAEFDFIFARAKLSHSMDAVEPEISVNGRIKLWQARHPLLKGEVVPIDIHLGDNFNILLITGPNTGGKTVSLKTVGLLNLMGQCGLHIPALPGSKIGVFTKILADIGDEQSIEQSLSTFSSHMTNIVKIMDIADEQSLVLLDELGAGTDPTEGAALAMALLEELLSLGSRVVATTHYSELKVFAYYNEGVENASVEFDVDTLQPTYHLMIGIPGRSNALEIAGRLGLRKEILTLAQSKLGQDQFEIDDMLSLLEENLKTSRRERAEADEILARAKREAEEIKASSSLSEQKAKDRYLKAQSEALGILKEARLQSDKLIKDLRAMRRNLSDRELMEITQKSRGTLSELSGKLSELDQGLDLDQGQSLKKVKIGQSVFWQQYKIDAVVLEEADSKGEVMIQAGLMKVSVPIKELRKGKEEKPKVDLVKRSQTFQNPLHSRGPGGQTQLDLRGQNLAEAILNTDKFIDDAFLAQINKVWIIHGKGTGVLRNGIREHLNDHRQVKSFVFAPFNEGGDGVTVVELK